MNAMVRVRSCRREGRLVPRQATGLRAGAVVLTPRGAMDWHSTRTREELLIALEGRVQVEVQTRRRHHAQGVRRIALMNGQCLFLPTRTRHRVINRTTKRAWYLYVTAEARS